MVRIIQGEKVAEINETAQNAAHRASFSISITKNITGGSAFLRQTSLHAKLGGAVKTS